MIDTYPEHPGAKVGGPSHDAADAMAEHALTLRERCLDLFATREWTSDEAAAHLNESVLAVRPRFSELVKRGYIEPTGGRRINSSGLTASVYRRKPVMPTIQLTLM